MANRLENALVCDLRNPKHWSSVDVGGDTVYYYKGLPAYHRSQSVLVDGGSGIHMLQSVRARTTFSVYVGCDMGEAGPRLYGSKKFKALCNDSHKGAYMMEIKGRLIDGIGGYTGAQFINDAKGGAGRTMTRRERVQAGLLVDRPHYNAKVNLAGGVESKGIALKVGDEVFFDYGDDYWKYPN
jgi:hypothetical protein